MVAGFKQLVAQPEYSSYNFVFRCSKGSEENLSAAVGSPVLAIKVKTEWSSLVSNYELIISLHCKQLFPAELVQALKCINVHPGLNPYNRGWFPQVFSILNGLPTGATIHEIDEELDHGNIIAQQEVGNNVWDTSIDIYNRVLQQELKLLDAYLPQILEDNYKTFEPNEEGNLNLKKDFNTLCELDIERVQRVGDTIDQLRALTHGEYQNAYFFDPKTGKKVYVSIRLETKEWVPRWLVFVL